MSVNVGCRGCGKFDCVCVNRGSMSGSETCLEAYRLNELWKFGGGQTKDRLAAALGYSPRHVMMCVSVGRAMATSDDDVLVERLHAAADISASRAAKVLEEYEEDAPSAMERRLIKARKAYREDSERIKSLVAILKNNQVPESQYEELIKGRLPDS